MNKSEFIEKLFTELQLNKGIHIPKAIITEVINTATEIVTQQLTMHKDVVISGFGTFTTTYPTLRRFKTTQKPTLLFANNKVVP